MKHIKKDKRTNLEKEIDSLLNVMKDTDPASSEYAAMAKNVSVLYESKALIKTNRVSADTWAVIAANLLGIGLIISYEQWAPVTSKALSFVIRNRV